VDKVFDLLLFKVLPELFRAVRMCEDGGLKEFITWKLGTLISIVRQVMCPKRSHFSSTYIASIENFFLLQLLARLFY
jgi:hypothetical protein